MVHCLASLFTVPFSWNTRVIAKSGITLYESIIMTTILNLSGNIDLYKHRKQNINIITMSDVYVIDGGNLSTCPSL